MNACQLLAGYFYDKRSWSYDIHRHRRDKTAAAKRKFFIFSPIEDKRNSEQSQFSKSTTTCDIATFYGVGLTALVYTLSRILEASHVLTW
jgi:hypothetical protein